METAPAAGILITQTQALFTPSIQAISLLPGFSCSGLRIALPHDTHRELFPM
jgi:hypothetical protein